MSLEQLKKIRSQRVERIYRELQKAKSLFEQAERELQQARVELQNYSIWRGEQKKSLFGALQGDCFSPNDIKGYNLKLEKLKEKESQLREVIPDVKVKLEDAKKDLDKAKEKLQNANKDMQKVDEFVHMQNEEAELIEEKQEENVADELSCFKSSQR